MDIGSAKPPAEQLQRFPHALVDVRDPTEIYSAADFLRDADSAVRRSLARGRLPVLVGGTMLYLRAFREGLAALPQANPEIRAQLQREGSSSGWAKLHAELALIDPDAAAGIHPNNPQRLVRALEVFRVSGRPISAFWREQRDRHVSRRLGAELLEVAILPDDRSALHQRIDRRFAAMLAGGLVEEVAALRRRFDLSRELPSMRAVGYRQVWDHLEGRVSLEELPTRGAAATRQLAKRQLTWVRGWPWVRHLTWGEPEALARSLLAEHQLEIWGG
jgi:tRNA dimethylallyltransferase